MQKIKIDEDIRSLSEVRNGMANFIKQVHDTNTHARNFGHNEA